MNELQNAISCSITPGVHRILTDNSQVVRLEVFADNELVALLPNSGQEALLRALWDAHDAPLGEHNLYAVAYDRNFKEIYLGDPEQLEIPALRVWGQAGSLLEAGGEKA